MTDFIVIGGGIAGVSAAARLSAHGTVTVLEAESALGYHASGRSAALFDTDYGLPSTVALNLASAEYHHTAQGGYLSPRGLMTVGREQDPNPFESDGDKGLMTRLSLDEALEMVPILNRDTVAFAGYHDQAWDIDTDRMIQDFARMTRAGGGQVLTGQSVVEISKGRGGWHVRTGKGVFEAPVLVNAAGAWADNIARMAGIAPLGLVPKRRSMARLPAPGNHDISRWPMIFAAGERWYAKPDAGKFLVSPSEEHAMEPHDAYPDDMVLAEGLARYEEMVTQPVTRVETSWAGLRTFSSDRGLVLGPDPDTPDFVWSAGQGGYGFQTAPAASQLVADLVSGADSVLDPDTVAALTPGRLRR
jgi:glycine/D-amino acid oxidase-like deaminating enzyme